MFEASLIGFCFAFPLLLGFGPQNIFVITQGIRREHPIIAVLGCAGSDAFLIGCGALGIGQRLVDWPLLVVGVATLGIFVMLRIAWSTLFDRAPIDAHELSSQGRRSALSVFGQALAVSLLNPAAIVDTLIILSAMVSTFPASVQFGVCVGASSASIVWFILLSLGGGWLVRIGRSPRALRAFNAVCAAGLLFATVQLWNALVRLL
jgi:L-lysine exporter family protein LysE/ArgO